MAEGPLADIGKIETWEQLEKACNIIGVTVQDCIDAALAPLGPPTGDEINKVLDVFYEVMGIAQRELVEEADSGNLERKHHLESAVIAFEGIGILLRAEDIVRHLLDPRTDDEAPTTD